MPKIEPHPKQTFTKSTLIFGYNAQDKPTIPIDDYLKWPNTQGRPTLKRQTDAKDT